MGSMIFLPVSDLGLPRAQLRGIIYVDYIVGGASELCNWTVLVQGALRVVFRDKWGLNSGRQAGEEEVLQGV